MISLDVVPWVTMRTVGISNPILADSENVSKESFKVTSKAINNTSSSEAYVEKLSDKNSSHTYLQVVKNKSRIDVKSSSKNENNKSSKSKSSNVLYVRTPVQNSFKE